MPTPGISTWGPAVAATIRQLRATPKLRQLCKLEAQGPLARADWTADESVAKFLATVKHPHRRRSLWKLLDAAEDHLKAEQQQIDALYDRAMASPEFAAGPWVAQQVFIQVVARSKDATYGGPNVLASHAVLVSSIYRSTGRELSLRSITYGWKWLVECGWLKVTPGVAFEGFDQARGTIYHLLDEANFISPPPSSRSGAYEVAQPTGPSRGLVIQLNRCFSEAVDHVRRLKYLLEHEGRPIRQEDLYRGRAKQMELAA